MFSLGSPLYEQHQGTGMPVYLMRLHLWGNAVQHGAVQHALLDHYACHALTVRLKYICPAKNVYALWYCCKQGFDAFRWAGDSIAFACCLCRWRWIALCRMSWSLSHTTLFPHSPRRLHCIFVYHGQDTNQHSVYLRGVSSASFSPSCLCLSPQITNKNWEQKLKLAPWYSHNELGSLSVFT